MSSLLDKFLKVYTVGSILLVQKVLLIKDVWATSIFTFLIDLGSAGSFVTTSHCVTPAWPSLNHFHHNLLLYQKYQVHFLLRIEKYFKFHQYTLGQICLLFHNLNQTELLFLTLRTKLLSKFTSKFNFYKNLFLFLKFYP